jgi:hypothetical protein
MRTTLELDDDLLAVAKQLAQQQGSTVGQVILKLARQCLMPTAPVKPATPCGCLRPRNPSCALSTNCEMKLEYHTPELNGRGALFAPNT